MALPINIGDLINHRKVEWARIEYKEGVHPAFLRKTAQKTALRTGDAVEGDILPKTPGGFGISAEDELSLIRERLKGAWKISQKTLSAKSLVRWSRIVQAILRDGSVTAHVLSDQLNATYRTIQSDMRTLKELNAIVRKGSDKGGEWIVTLKYIQKG